MWWSSKWLLQMESSKRFPNATTQNFSGHFVEVAVERESIHPFWSSENLLECSFGIVTAGTVKVYPTFPIVVTRFMVNSTKEYDPKLFEAVAYFLQNGSKYRDRNGLQGYFYVYPKGFHSVL